MHARNYDGANACIREGTYLSLQQGRARYMHSSRMRLADIPDRRLAVGVEPGGTEEQRMVEACQSKPSIVSSNKTCKNRCPQPGIQGERRLIAKSRQRTYIAALSEYLVALQGTTKVYKRLS
jgi:hypothetical protein